MKPVPGIPVPPGRRARRHLSVEALVLCGAGALAALVLIHAAWRCSYRYELDPLEGAMLYSCFKVSRHLPLYSVPGTIPYASYIYPPGYYFLGSLLLRLTGPTLVSLRIASVAAMLLCAISMGGLLFSEKRDARGALFSGLIYLTTYPMMLFYYDTVRLDGVWLAILAGGVYLLACPRSGLVRAFLGSGLLLSACAVKHNAVILILGVCAGLYHAGRRKTSFALGLAAVSWVVVFLVGLDRVTGGASTGCLITDPQRQPYSAVQYAANLRFALLSVGALVPLLALGIREGWRRKDAPTSVMLGWAAASVVAALPTGKLGGGPSNFMPLILALSFFSGSGLCLARGAWRGGLLPCVVASSVGLHLFFNLFVPCVPAPADVRDMRRLESLVRASKGLIYLEGTMELAAFAANESAIDGYRIWELHRAGYGVPAGLLRAIRNHRVDLVTCSEEWCPAQIAELTQQEYVRVMTFQPSFRRRPLGVFVPPERVAPGWPGTVERKPGR